MLKEVYALKSMFSKHGAKLYVVGGWVRDFYRSILTGEQFIAKDCDLVTDLHPDKVVELLLSEIDSGHLDKRISIREVGKSFGVVLVTIGGKDFEIATFREDAKSGDGRRPDYVTFSTIDKDAERRDLTINSLYYDLEEECIIDYFEGIEDIQNNRVRFVGDAYARIHEDKLRMLRFARFFCRMNDNETNLDKDAEEVIKKTKLRPEISDERIRDEFLKGLASSISISFYLNVLNKLGLLEQVFLEMQLSEMVQEFSVPEFVVAQILRYNDPSQVKKNLLQLRYTAQESTDISFLLKIPHWCKEDQFVDFKKGERRSSLDKAMLLKYAMLFGDRIAVEMLEAPYPNFSGDTIVQETGLEGKALGEELIRRECEFFRNWRDQNF